MPQPLQHRRGATLPASLAAGEFFFKTDTQVWYSGPTGGGTPILAGNARLSVVDQFGNVVANNWTLGVFTYILTGQWMLQGVDGSEFSGIASVDNNYPNFWILDGASSIEFFSNAPIVGVDSLTDFFVTGAVQVGGSVWLYYEGGTPENPGDGNIQGLVFFRTV
jgi:hypothetical protein